jgi:hypothetical protein
MGLLSSPHMALHRLRTVGSSRLSLPPTLPLPPPSLLLTLPLTTPTLPHLSPLLLPMAE